MGPLCLVVLILKTLSMMILNFLKPILPVGLARGQQLPPSGGDGGWGQGGQVSPSGPRLLGCMSEEQAKPGVGEEKCTGEAGQEGVLPDSSQVF